jgi:hypothetical protein
LRKALDRRKRVRQCDSSRGRRARIKAAAPADGAARREFTVIRLTSAHDVKT